MSIEKALAQCRRGTGSEKTSARPEGDRAECMGGTSEWPEDQSPGPEEEVGSRTGQEAGQRAGPGRHKGSEDLK